MTTAALTARGEISEAAFRADLRDVHADTDRLFGHLLVVQWLAGVAAAIWISPLTWTGTTSRVHPHLLAAIFLGGLVAAVPAILARRRPGDLITRQAIAVGQAITSALLIHLTGGRIETHFHVFGSLALLAFYRDPGVLYTATAIVGLDHYLRGVLWPQSVYGVLSAGQWRWLEHVGWVAFEVTFLVRSCYRSRAEMREIAARHTELRAVNDDMERQVAARTSELERAQLRLVAAAKLETVGRLAASVAHEVKNPLGIILMGVSYLKQVPARDDRSGLLLEDMESAVRQADSVVRGLLDLAAPRGLQLQPSSIHEQIERSLQLVRGSLIASRVQVERRFAAQLPPVKLDNPKIHQVLVNLLVNSCQAMEDRGGRITLTTGARRLTSRDPGTGRRSMDPFRPGQQVVEVIVDDEGPGITAERLPQIFDPFFTTKSNKGTGLGLAVVRKIMELHGGTIDIVNRPEGGARAILVLPCSEEPAP